MRLELILAGLIGLCGCKSQEYYVDKAMDEISSEKYFTQEVEEELSNNSVEVKSINTNGQYKTDHVIVDDQDFSEEKIKRIVVHESFHDVWEKLMTDKKGFFKESYTIYGMILMYDEIDQALGINPIYCQPWTATASVLQDKRMKNLALTLSENISELKKTLGIVTEYFPEVPGSGWDLELAYPNEAERDLFIEKYHFASRTGCYDNGNGRISSAHHKAGVEVEISLCADIEWNSLSKEEKKEFFDHTQSLFYSVCIANRVKEAIIEEAELNPEYIDLYKAIFVDTLDKYMIDIYESEEVEDRDFFLGTEIFAFIGEVAYDKKDITFIPDTLLPFYQNFLSLSTISQQ